MNAARLRAPRLTVAALVLATPLAARAADRPADAPVPDPLPSYQQCYAQAPGQVSNVAAACRGFEKFGQDASALCRRLLQDDAACVTPFAPPVERREVAAYQSTWVHRALVLQRALGDDLPFREAQWLGTHNSFNAVPDGPNDPPPGLSQLDSNQQLSMVDQLDSDMRSLEVDAHWALDPHTGQDEVRLCHAESGGYGCTIEGTLAQGLAPVADWVQRHPGEVLFLYVDDDLQNHAGHEAAAQVVEHAFGSLVYRSSDDPSAGDRAGVCRPLDLALTRAQVLAAGKRVVVWSTCEDGATTSSWNDLVFNDAGKFEQTTSSYADFPACDGPQAQQHYGRTFVRYYEDSTFVSALATPDGDHIDAPMAAHMARCGVNLVGFDQLLPDDSRLAGSIWSWAQDEPSAAGACAVARASDGRFVAVPCSGRHAVACRSGSGWTVLAPAVAVAAAAGRCGASAGAFAVPRSGREGALLQAALQRAGATDAWIAYTDTNGGWAPHDGR